MIYISGPMTGLPNYNHDEFHRVYDLLVSKGFDVFNPAAIRLRDIPHGYKPIDQNDARRVWQAYMKECVRHIPDCRLIVTLQGWRESEGAMCEVRIAEMLGIEVISLGEFLEMEDMT